MVLTKKEKKQTETPAVEPEVMTAEEVAAEEAAEMAEEAAEETAAEEEPTISAEEAAEKLAVAYKELQAAKEESDNQRLRLQADFDNFRKRTRTEKEQWRNQLIAEICGELLPVLDNFHWAITAMEKTDAESPHLAGVQMIEKQILGVMANKGVVKIETAGADFDPQFHDAIGQVEVEDAEQVGKVFDEALAGYKIGDKVLRPAKVRTACAKAE